MSFGTTDVKEKQLKYVGYGTQKLMITDMTISEAQSGTPRVVFNVQSEDVTTPGWTGADGAKGLVGKIRSSYLKTDKQILYFNEQINDIAKVMGVYDEVKNIGKVEDINDFVNKLRPLITGKFAWFTVAAEEYLKTDGVNKGISLHFPRFGFVGATEVAVRPFDMTQPYHFKKVTMPSRDTDMSVDMTDDEAQPEETANF